MKVIMMTQLELAGRERTVVLFAKPQRAWDELVEVANYIGVRTEEIEGTLEQLAEGGSESICRADNGEALLTLEWKEVHE